MGVMTDDRMTLPPDGSRTASGPVLDVACLCAAWCRTCDEYAEVFRQLRQALPAHRYRWIDIEDEAELIGDVDVETFPTLLLAHQGRVLFAGPVLPRLGDVQRLVQVSTEQVLRGGVGQAAALALPPGQAEALEVLAQRLSLPNEAQAG